MNPLLRLRALFRKERLHAEMAAEIQCHLEEQTRENIARGMASSEARYAAQRAFGGIEQIKERCRDVRGWPWLEDFGCDVSYGARSLRRNPGFATAAMLTLALGIGANTAVFSLMHRLLFTHLPVAAPERLVVVERRNLAAHESTTFPHLFFQTFEAEKKAFEGIIARSRGVERVTVDAESGGAPARGELVSGNYYEVLGVRPHLGRLLTAADDITPGAHPVVVLSHRYWQRQFGGDTDVVGKTIRLTGQPMTVIGVSPAEFHGLDPNQDIDLRVPLAMQAELRGGRSIPNQRGGDLQLVARLQRGVDIAQAQALASGRWRQFLDDQEPVSEPNRQMRESERIELRPAAAGYGQAQKKFQPVLQVLIAITGAVLLVACLNLASLLLARSATRRHEFALRLALGAGTGRLMRQLMAEGLLLALGGASLGALFAFPCASALLRLISSDGAPLDLPAQLNGAVLLCLVATAAGCGVLFGLAPAWYVRRQILAPGLKGGARGGSAMRGRKVLVCAQVAASFVVLTGAGLFVRTVHTLRTTNPGFEPGHLLLAAMSPKNAGRNDAQSLAFFRDVRERVAALPGVTGVTYSMVRALAGNLVPAAVVADGTSLPENTPLPTRNVVGPDYFRTFGTALVVGRDFTPGDDAPAPKVAIVNERFAKLYFPGQDPIGRKIGPTQPDFTIIGVARDIRHTHVRTPAAPQWYVTYEQFPAAKYLDLCVRTTGDPETMQSAIRAAIAEVDRGVALFEVRTQEAQFELLLTTERTLATLATFFGLIAAALAAVGLYGLLAYLVAQQRREIGIRLALGARPAVVWRTVLRRGLSLTLIGAVIGVMVAFAATRGIEGLLFGVTAGDPLTFLLAACLLLGVSFLACWLPARQAAKVNPMVALRAE